MISCLFKAPDNVESNQNTKAVDKNLKVNDVEIEISEVFKGDLYIIGQVWIKALQKALTGANVNIIPVVHAAKPSDVPQRPPKMKCTDLPLYKSPHSEYKDYKLDKTKCADANVKLLHRLLLPYVKANREMVTQYSCSIKHSLDRVSTNACAAIRVAKDDFKQNMRDPNNIAVRQGVVTAGTLTGCLIGGGGGIPRRVLFTSVGFLSTGALCFPKETDDIFRTFTYMVGKSCLIIYSNICGKEVNIRERMPCSDDVPTRTPQGKPIECPPKK